MNQTALLVIDLQNDYFSGGKFPLWNTDQTLIHIKSAIKLARQQSCLIVNVQHVADPRKGIAPFFNEGTEGVAIHDDILQLTHNDETVVKHFADGFEQTNLDELLQSHGIKNIILCGMMTQNCVTHTALSKAAEKYQVSILAECTTTVTEMVHLIALNALQPRIPLVTIEQAFK